MKPEMIAKVLMESTDNPNLFAEYYLKVRVVVLLLLVHSPSPFCQLEGD